MNDAPDRLDEVRQWVATRSAEILDSDELQRLIDLVDNRIAAEVPEIGANPAIRGVLDASTRGALTLYLSRLPDVAPGTVDATPEMQLLGRDLARRGADVGVLLKAYRVGQRVMWQELMDQVAAAGLDRELQGQVLAFLWDHLSRTLEHVVEDVVAAYVTESEQRLEGRFARRAETIAAMLRGDDIDVDLASTATGHRISRHQTALVIWDSAAGKEGGLGGRLDQLARDIAEAVGAGTPLIAPTGTGLWAWLATGPAPALDTVASLPAVRSASDLRVALGEPAPGVAGFRESHRQAMRAYDIARASARPSQVTRYVDVAVLGLLAQDEAAMRELVARELGGLAARDPATGRLRETLLAYLATGSSARAADRLTVHKNTVLYRLQQVEQLLGHPPDERRFELEAALRLAATYGDDVLPAP